MKSASVKVSLALLLLVLPLALSLNITSHRRLQSSSSSSSSDEINCGFFNRIFKSKQCKAQAASSSSSVAAAAAAAASSQANSKYQGSYNAYYNYYSSSSASISLAQQTSDISYCTRSRDCDYISYANSLLLGYYGNTYDYYTGSTTYNYYNYYGYSSSSGYYDYSYDLDYCCMHVNFVDRNGDDRSHQYCERDQDGIDDLYFKFFQAAGVSDIDTRCVDRVKLEWYIIVFVIVLPIIICMILIAVVIYFCWEQNAFSPKAKRAKLYEQTLDNTMNATATPNYYDLKLELEKAGVLRTDLSAVEQDKAIEELAKRVAKNQDQGGDYFTRQQMENATPS